MKKIIVIDDDPTNAGLIKMLLELDGYEVTAGSDEEEAIAATQKDTSAFVIDCNLARGASGIDILRKVRNGQTDASQDAIVIMTSGDYRLENETIEAGANQFLLKPYSPDILSKEIANLTTTGANNEQ